jgi:O-antigen ligase
MIPYASPKLNKFLTITLKLYVIAILTSMALISLTTNLLAITATILWIIHWRKSGSLKGFWPQLGPDIYLWLYWGAVTVSAIFVTSIPTPWDRWDCFSEGKWIWFLYGIAFTLTYTKIKIEKIITFLIWIALPVTILSIYFSLTGSALFRDMNPSYHLPGYPFWRAEGFFSNPLTFAYSMSMLLLGLLPFYLFGVFRVNNSNELSTSNKIEISKIDWQSKRLQSVLLLLLLLICVCIFLTLSRGAWLALAIAGVPTLLLWNKKNASIIFISGAVVFGLLFFTSPTFKKRIDSYQDPASHQIRYNIWGANIKMFEDYPWLGLGARRNTSHLKDYADNSLDKALINTHSHNNFLEVLTGAGIFGFIFWIITMSSFLIICIKGLFNSTNNFAKATYLGSFGAQLVFHLGGITQATFIDSEVLLMFCFWIAILVLIPKLNQTNINNFKPNNQNAIK